MKSKNSPSPSNTSPKAAQPPGSEADEARAFLRRGGWFTLVGFFLYLGVYLGSEWLVYETAQRNRFFTVKAAPQSQYNHVILGASHAAVFDYRDMNARLEELTETQILNLATEGSGVTVNRILLEYFYETGLETDTVVYVVDSFAFYSPDWNEVRLQDAELYARAPFDPTLARILLANPAGRPVLLNYLTGFSKINNGNRLDSDLFEAEGSRFDRSYRPIAQIDRQRLRFLYPDNIDASTLEGSPYLQEFEALAGYVQDRGDRFIIIRPPMPERIYQMIPNEQEFDRIIRQLAQRHGVEVHDFTAVNNAADYFYDSDHLNQIGTLQFFDRHLQSVLTVE
jgi:hypothetical protein